mgnify:CR=1 FL=1
MSDPALVATSMESWHSYPSIFALGHRAIAELLLDPVLVQEKVDGSQCSFGLFPDGYRARSKGAQLNILAPDKMFAKAVEIIQSLPLHEGWTYRAEYLTKPKHNALAYARIPTNHLIMFDINTGHETYLDYAGVCDEAARLGLEVVPSLFSGVVTDLQMFRAFLESVSILGGQKIEGVVVKNYARFGADKKVLVGKFVSEEYKEVHSREWKIANPTRGDLIEALGAKYHSAARWQKALQHLRDGGQIEDSPRDIALLMREVPLDVAKECEDDIKQALFDHAWPKIRRMLATGLPEWYKEQLLKRQFEATP